MNVSALHQQTLPCFEEEPAFSLFPKTRYQGSKRKLLKALYKVFLPLSFNSVLDLYSGSGSVTLLLRSMNKATYANDYLKYNSVVADFFLSCGRSTLEKLNFDKDIKWLLYDAPLLSEPLVSSNFQGIYFTDKENLEIDRFCQNINSLDDTAKKVYTFALGQSLLMKRPYNLFHRANLSMREKDIPRSFGNAVTWETSIETHMKKIINEIKRFPFSDSENRGKSYNYNTTNLNALPNSVDLIYMDPPYLNRKGMGVNYSEFYHFLEGLCDYSLFGKGDEKYPHKPISKKTSAWDTVQGAEDEIKRIAQKWPKATIVISYRTDGLPNRDAMIAVLDQFNRKTEVKHEEAYKYALSNVKDSAEQILVSIPD